MRRLVLLLAVPVVLTGCTALAVVPVATSLYPVVEDNFSGPATASAAPKAASQIQDPGDAWERVWYGRDGGVLRPQDIQNGVAVSALEWMLPVEVTGAVSAVVAFSHVPCMDGPVPQSWRILRATDASSVGEPWRVVHNRASGSFAVPGRSTLGLAEAEVLRRRAGLPDRVEMQFALTLPGPGLYYLAIRWSGPSLESLATIRPCISGWGRVPLGDLLVETVSGPSTPPSTPSGAPASRPVVANTSDRGASALPSAPSPEPQADSSVPDPVTPTSSILDRIGILGVPEYDLIRLHQFALQGLSRGDGATAAVTPLERRILWETREDRLQALVGAGEDGQRRLCTLAVRHAMDQRPLPLWVGQPTIPTELTATCR